MHFYLVTINKKGSLMKSSQKKTFDFEAAMSQLEQVVSQMETGTMGLELSLQKFEEGIRLIRECQTFLEKAEQKIQILSQKKGESGSEWVDYQKDEGEDD
jgi:exodeoxyribonuclease VII small subunit